MTVHSYGYDEGEKVEVIINGSKTTYYEDDGYRGWNILTYHKSNGDFSAHRSFDLYDDEDDERQAMRNYLNTISDDYWLVFAIVDTGTYSWDLRFDEFHTFGMNNFEVHYRYSFAGIGYRGLGTGNGWNNYVGSSERSSTSTCIFKCHDRCATCSNISSCNTCKDSSRTTSSFC